MVCSLHMKIQHTSSRGIIGSGTHLRSKIFLELPIRAVTFRRKFIAEIQKYRLLRLSLTRSLRFLTFLHVSHLKNWKHFVKNQNFLPLDAKSQNLPPPDYAATYSILISSCSVSSCFARSLMSMSDVCQSSDCNDLYKQRSFDLA